MYAIIRSGGKQYTVKPGDVLRVERLDGELGAELKLTDVIMVGGDKSFFGAPILDQASVTAIVTNQQRGPKLIVFKKKRRQGYRRMNGHRQYYTELFIKAITTPEGQTENANGDAQVFDPEKKAARVAKTAELKKAKRTPASKSVTEEVSAAPAPKAAKVAKKASKKTTGKKKATKKVAKKATKKASKKE